MHRTGSLRRSWRRSRSATRGVSPLIATILLVAMTIVLAAVLYILLSGVVRNTPSTPLGTELSLAPPREESAGTTHHWYNFTIVVAGGGIRYGQLTFQLQTTTASIVQLPAGTTVKALDLYGVTRATYNVATASWSMGASLAVSNTHRLVLDSGSLQLSGDRLIVYGNNGVSGSISANIP